MSFIHRSISAAVWLLAFAAAQTQAADLTLPRDGWVSWDVEAVEGAKAMCCWSDRKGREASPTTCRLDSENGSFGSRDNTTTDTIRVYAKLAAGKLERLRALAPSCPVETASPVKTLETTTDDSARWLIQLAKDDPDPALSRRYTDNVLAALAMHRGDVAQKALTSIARNDASEEMRKDAVFWLALLRGAEGAEVASSVMFNDKDPDVRQHAAFAVSQSESPRAVSDLIRLGNNDKDSDVRAQAWFWLAQTGSVEAEQAINAALRRDEDHHVREQAIFALSQLPEPRATKALIATAEDRSLAREQRNKAVFWLSHSESASALAYLDKVLTR